MENKEKKDIQTEPRHHRLRTRIVEDKTKYNRKKIISPCQKYEEDS